MSGAALYIKKDLKITDVQLEIVMGILNFYSLIGSFAAGRTSDWIGRRFTVVVAAAFFFVGALLMGLAGDYATLMLGRFVAGVGVGYGLMTPAAPPQLAHHARHRRGAVRPAGAPGVRHARVPPLARHEGPPRGRQGCTGQNRPDAGGGCGTPGRHQRRRRNLARSRRNLARSRRRRGCRAQEEKRRGEAGLEGADPVPDPDRAAHPACDAWPPILPAGFRR